MATLPIAVGEFDDAKGFIGQEYFYGPVTLTNTGRTDLTNISVVIDRFEDGPGNFNDFIDIFYVPSGISIKAGETKVVAIVYKPKKVSTPDFSPRAWWYVYLHLEDKNGNSTRSAFSHTAFVMPDKYQDVKQAFLKKWKPDETKSEFIYSYTLDLITEVGVGTRVYDWYLFFDLPDGAHILPDWLKTQSNWLELLDASTPVSNTILGTLGDASHTLDPGSVLRLDIQIVYPGSSSKYETINHLALNYNYRHSMAIKRHVN